MELVVQKLWYAFAPYGEVIAARGPASISMPAWRHGAGPGRACRWC